jgi:L-lactate utilization protein LutC
MCREAIPHAVIELEHFGVPFSSTVAGTLIVLPNPADIVVNLHRACRRLEFRDNHYACFHTGPSASANIEGVLIHGAGRALAFCATGRASRGLFVA